MDLGERAREREESSHCWHFFCGERGDRGRRCVPACEQRRTMEVIAGGGLVRGRYSSHTDFGQGVGLASTTASSLQSCKSLFHRNSSAFRRETGYDFVTNLVSVGDSQFPLKASSASASRCSANAAARATGNGAFTGGNRAEEVNEALSTMLPHTAIETDSAAFRAILAAIASLALAAEKERQQERTDVPVDGLRQGRLVESQLVYRQTFVIRSYEIGADRTASIETLMNHFQVIDPIFATILHVFHKSAQVVCTRIYQAGCAGDGFESCVDIWAGWRWLRSNTRHVLQEPNLGRHSDASSR